MTIRSVMIAAFFVLLSRSPLAQSDINFNPPDIKAVDAVGVNLVSGYPHPAFTTTTIGPKGRDLSHSLSYSWGVGLPSDYRSDQWYGGVYTTYGTLSDSLGQPLMDCIAQPGLPSSGVAVMVAALGDSERFCFYNGVFYSERHRGATLTKNADGTYLYVSKDGTRYVADPAIGDGISGCITTVAIAAIVPCAFFTSVVRPDGTQIELAFETANVTINGVVAKASRLRSVNSNNGYKIRFEFSSEIAPNLSTLNAWRTETSVVAFNGATDYCAPLSIMCTFSRSWPSATFSLDAGYDFAVPGEHGLNVTNSGGQTTRIVTTTFPPPTAANSSYSRISRTKGPTSSSQDTWSATYGNYVVCYSDGIAWQCNAKRTGLVRTVTTASGVWNYSHIYEDVGTPTMNMQSPVYYYWQTTSTGPDGRTVTARYNLKTGYLASVAGTNGYANFTTDGTNRVASAGDEEGRNYTFVYDDRGNIKEKHQVAATGSGYPDIVISADYDAVCVYPAKCNKPNWVKDANGNQTDYTYDLTHGGILTKTLPAVYVPGVGMARPQTRYSYVQRYAWYKNASGTMARAATPIWVLDRESYCKTQGPNISNTGCAALNADGTSDEVVTQYDYGPDAGPNNLLLVGTTVTAGGVTRRTCYGYDALGNKISETTPNALLTSCPGVSY